MWLGGNITLSNFYQFKYCYFKYTLNISYGLDAEFHMNIISNSLHA